MVELALALIGMLVVACTMILLDWWRNSWLPSKRLPPGPAPWPIIGSLHRVLRLGPSFLAASKKLEADYGKIITLWIGKKPVIVIADPELGYDGLMRQGALFANRCKLSSGLQLSGGNHMIHNTDGAYTVTLRKTLMTHVLSASSLKSMKSKRDSTLEDIITRVKTLALANQGATEVNVSSMMRLGFFRYNLYVCFGMDLEEKIIRATDNLMIERMRCGYVVYLGDYIPVWKIFECKARHAFAGKRKHTEELLCPLINRFREMKLAGKNVDGTYLEGLLDLQEKEGPEFLSDQAIIALCCELLNASTHTVTGVVASAMLELSLNSDTQTKLFEEIKIVVGDRPVGEKDLKNLPYLQAVCREALRMHPPLPSCVPRAVAEPCKLGGYDIPTHAVLLFHIDEYQYNSANWVDPTSFKPERFLGVEVDLTGTKDVNLIPFGAGRRMCPGTTLALLEMSMMIARMVQTFEWDTIRSTSTKSQGEAPSSLTTQSGEKPGAKYELARTRSTELVRLEAKGPLFARLR